MSEVVVSGLVKGRAELAGDIERTHDQLRKMVAAGSNHRYDCWNQQAHVGLLFSELKVDL